MARIAVIAGDGIGKEVVPEAVAVLRRVTETGGPTLEFVDWPHGADHFLDTGHTLQDSEVADLRENYDAILLGALGDPRVPGNRHARDILLGLRTKLDLFINYRPIRLLDDRLSPLKGRTRQDFDIRIFRENTEGAYVGAGGVFRQGTSEEVAVQEDLTTRRGVERIVRAAFEHARDGHLNRVTMADKANAMEYVGGVWRRVFAEVADEYAEIEAEAVYADMLAMDLIRRPQRYQVIVTGNLFGDILSDLAAQLVGGLGVSASANLHPGAVSMFEPVHGSALDLVGTGRANPIGAILSAALLLDFLGRTEASRTIEEAVRVAVEAGDTTPDLGGKLSTREAAEAIRRRIRG
jgi:3-isopropylmalate dehydrogenase